MQLPRMNNLKNNLPADRQATERRMLPFFVEFVKFATGFAVIIAVALLALNVTAAAIQ